ASGETLAKNVDLTLYVRDRAPSVVFPGRAYVLPKSAEAALPVETVNLDTIDLTLRRISDRNLIRTIQEGYFGGPLHYYELREFDADVAEVVWSGKGEVQNTLNRDIMTRLPLGDVLANQPAG